MLFLCELGVEGYCAGFEVCILGERAGLRGAVLAVHAAVFPFDGERALIVDVIERPDDLLEVDGAVPQGSEIPVPFGIAKVGMAPKHPCSLERGGPIDVLHMDVVNAVAKLIDEPNIVYTLVAQVAWIVVEPELG